MSLPKLPLPVWSTTGGTYTAPGEDWDGTAVNVDPGDTLRASGYTPEDRPNAEHLNYQLNSLGRWVEWLQKFPAYNWQTFSSVITTDHESYGLLCSENFNRIYSYGREDDTIGTDTSMYSSYEGGHPNDWIPENLPGGDGTLTCGSERVSATTPVLMVGRDDGVVIKKTAIAGNWNTTNVLDDAETVLDILYVPSATSWIAVGATSVGGAVWRSIDSGDSWDLEFESASISEGLHLAGNTTGDVIIALTDTDDVLLSTDFGDSWAIQTTPFGDTPNVIAYSAEEDLFMVAGDSFVYTSVDGVTWTSRTATGYIGGRVPRGLVSIGGAWVALIPSTVITPVTDPHGALMVSFDSGNTWSVTFPFSVVHTLRSGTSGISRMLHICETSKRMYALGVSDVPRSTFVSRSIRMQANI